MLDDLRKMLNDVGISDAYISRGVRLTDIGLRKMSKRFGVSAEEVIKMLVQLKLHVRDDIAENLNEHIERYAYETDYMGNITIRDSQTGDERFLQGDEAFELGQILITHPGMQQDTLSEYFNNEISESVDGDSVEDGFGEMAADEGGTFNFPYRGMFATARFWKDAKGFNINVVSLRNTTDEEQNISPDLREKLNKIAMTWVDKV